MKVLIHPSFDQPDKGEGGIRRVCENQLKYLPDHGIEFTNNLNEADVINCHATAILDHPRIVHSLHGLYWAEYDWLPFAHKANRYLIEIMKDARVKVITSPSEWVAHSVRRGMLKNPKVIYHGIDIDLWQPPAEHENYVIWAKTREDPVCSSAPLNWLAERTPELRFITTFGNSDLENVIAIGKVPLQTIKPIIQKAKIYLANVMETGGITLLEAMASGVVPLGYDWGVNPEIITHMENGYLVPPGDNEALIKGLAYCQMNWARLSEAARQTVVDRFQWKDVIGGYAQAYQNALQENASPKISVIITAYNLEEFLPDAIESVLSQKETDWELIIVDDHSPDKCGRIADRYGRENPKIKVIHNRENVYLAEARNIGCRMSSGKYIIPLDADDMLGDDALGILSRALEGDSSLHIATGAMELIEEDGQRWVSDWPWKEPSYHHQIAKKNQFPYCSMYRRSVWEDTGGYRRRSRTAEDACFWTRALSYGAKGAKVTDKPTLVYRNRSASMSHKEAEPDWTSWSLWSRIPELTPYGATPPKDKETWPVYIYGPSQATVVIPVGPGHDIFLQDCLDSLASQTFLNFDIIVVNDTGERWLDDTGKVINPYLQGFPYVRILDGEEQTGVAAARNRGIAASTTDLFILLDADDYTQSLFVELMVKAQRAFGGWVYSDWYDQDGQRKESEEWNASRFINKMLGPSTGIYPKAAWKFVGGFDEEAAGWEDYVFQLALFSAGVCGSRIPEPVFTYRYHTGSRREVDFENGGELIQYIKNKFSSLYDGGETFMGCRKCPGGGGRTNMKLQAAATLDIRNASGENVLVTLEYIGNQTQRRRWRSKFNPRREYSFSAASPIIQVYPEDAAWMENHIDFRRIEQPRMPEPIISDLPVMVAERTPTPLPPLPSQPPEEPVMPTSMSIDILNLSAATITTLKNAGFETVDALPKSVAQLCAVPNIGEKRARQILEAIDVLGI